MDGVRDHLSTCEGKDKLSFAQARKIAKKRRGSVRLDAYKCPFCRRWHVGGRPPRLKKPK